MQAVEHLMREKEGKRKGIQLTMSVRGVVVEVPGEVVAETVGALSCRLMSPRTVVVVAVDHSLHYHSDSGFFSLYVS